MIKLILAAVLLCLAGPAAADPVTIIATIATFAVENIWIKAAIAIASAAYSSSQARRKARKDMIAAKAAYNAGLEERTITLLNGTPPWRIVYGRAMTGGDIIASFVSDKQGIDDAGNAYTKPDGYRHLVVHIATHECHAIHGAYFAGLAVGPLDGNGWATTWSEQRTVVFRTQAKLPYKALSLISATDGTNNQLSNLTLSSDGRTVSGPAGVRIRLVYSALRDDFVKSGNYTRQVAFTGTTVLTEDAEAIAYVWPIYQNDSAIIEPTVTIAPDKRTLTSTEATIPTIVTYTVKPSQPLLRISYHLGAAGQTVDTYLNSIVPEKWTAQHTLDGLTYAVVTVDLEEQRFQGGIQELSFDVSGRKVYDPRSSLTAWSNNPALCINDYLLQVWGLGCDASEVNQDYLIAAANVCDTANTFEQVDSEFNITTTTTGPLYTLNGVVTTDQGKEAVIEEMAGAMAGWVVDSSQWLIIAGAWSASVRDLVDDDLVGSIEIVQADNPIDQTFNMMRGTYLPAGALQPTDFTPYRNTTLITSDGQELSDSPQFPFTDSNPRCVNLARIIVEQSRAGLVIKYPAKLKAWRLQIGDRVRVTSSELQCTNKYFRVTDWQHTLTAPVELILQEDYADVWDTVDTVTADPTRDINMPNAWHVAPLQNVQVNSGTSELVIGADGTIIVRAKVSWDLPTDSYVLSSGGRIEMRYLRITPSTGVVENGSQIVQQTSAITSLWINNLRDGDGLVIKLYAVNTLGVKSEEVIVSHTVVGKSQAPGAVTGLAATVTSTNGDVVVTWDNPSDVDYAATELRTTNANWNTNTPSPAFRGSATAWATTVSAAGTYTWFAVNIDTSGNVSSVASVTLNVTAEDLGGQTPVVAGGLAAITVVADWADTVNTNTPLSATVTAMRGSTNEAGNYTWTRVSSAGLTTTISGPTVTLTGMSTGTLTGTITLTGTRSGWPDLTWTIAVNKMLRAQTSTVAGGPASLTVSADWADTVNENLPLSANISAMNGSTNEAGNYTWTRVSSAGLTTTISGPTVTLTGMSTGTLTGTITLTGTRSGWPDLTWTIVVNKILKAQPVPQITAASNLIVPGAVDGSVPVSSLPVGTTVVVRQC